MKKYYKFFILLIVVSSIIPQIALASWWNPFTWHQSQNNPSSAKTSTPTQTSKMQVSSETSKAITSTSQQASISDTSTNNSEADVIQLKETIAQLRQQLKDYRCPTESCPTCPTCPVCQAPLPSTTTSAPTPLTAICIINPNPTAQGKLTTFTIRANGGTGIYYYTYLGNSYVKLPSCSGTTSDLTCTTCFGGGGLCPSAYNDNAGAFMSNRGKIVVQVSDSGGQIKNITCPELIVQ